RGASAAIRSVSNASVATIPVMAGSSTSRVSTESKTGSLSSWRSRLYASGSALSVASSPVRLPTSRPALPRASSAMSGFFFCGMMLDPVDQESCSVTKPNSLVDHRITSSAIRDRSTPTIAQTKASSATKSREAVPSMEFRVAQQRPCVGQQVVREQHRLGVLEVRPPRHQHVEVPASLVGDRLHEVDHQQADRVRVVAEEHLEQRRHLVVATAPGAEPTA